MVRWRVPEGFFQQRVLAYTCSLRFIDYGNLERRVGLYHFLKIKCYMCENVHNTGCRVQVESTHCRIHRRALAHFFYTGRSRVAEIARIFSQDFV